MGGVNVFKVYESIVIICVIVYLVYMLIRQCDYKCNKSLHKIMTVILIIWALVIISQLLLWCFR